MWPLTQLLKKDAFNWNEQAELAFVQLKAAFTLAPILALSNFGMPFELEANTSERGVGTVLMQNRKPISYFSHPFSNIHKYKSIYEKELMAVDLAIMKWKQYLLR